MEAGPWTGKDCSAPWMYHRVAGQYTLWEKQLLADFSPRQRRPSPRVLQDSTNWHAAQPPPPWGPLRHDGPRLPGKEGKRAAAAAAASPKPRSPRSPTYDGLPAVCRREPAWGAALPPKPPSEDAAAPDGSHGPLGAPGKLRGDLPARSPPSYEAHMLLRAAQAPRKENRPRPPPYVAPPSYGAAHRTVRPQRRPSRAPAEAPPARQAGPRTPSAGPKGRPGQAAAPGRRSCLVGARTWAGRRRPAGRAEASPGWAPGWPRTPPPRSHTLPRAAKRGPAACPPPDGSGPPHALPAGWAFSRAAGLERRGSPERKESRGRRREGGGGSPEGAGAGAAARRAGGLLVIDATCVVIRTHYIPPARAERVRYVGRAGAKPSPPPAAPPASPPASPPAGSLEERASRILGLPVSELGFREPGGPASPRRRAEGRCPEGPQRAAPSPQRSPAQPRPTPAPESGPPEPEPEPEPGPVGLQVARVADAGQGRAPLAEAEPACSPPSRSYVRDLRAAMSRIRRHTAPDSDTDEELEKARRPAGRPFPRHEAAPSDSSSSSSSCESLGSDATVVPGHADAATPSHGPRRGWLRPSAAVP